MLSAPFSILSLCGCYLNTLHIALFNLENQFVYLHCCSPCDSFPVNEFAVHFVILEFLCLLERCFVADYSLSKVILYTFFTLYFVKI